MENENVQTDKRGKIRSSEERQRLVDEFRSSGMAAGVFARERGVAYTTLCNWLKGIRLGDDLKPEKIRLQAVKTTGIFSSPVVEVVLDGGVTVRVYR